MSQTTHSTPPRPATDLLHSEQVYRRLVRDNPRHTEAWFQLGLVLMRQGRHAAAIECLEQTAALDPAQEVLDHYLGLCHQALGQLDKAVTYFTRFAEHRPDSAEVHNNLGITYARLRQRDKAAACFEQALRVKAEFPEVHNNLANVLAEDGKLAEAAEHYRRALALLPSYADAHHNLGVVLRRQGDTAGAIASFRQAIALNGRYVEALLHLGETCTGAGRLDDAAAAYRQLLTVKPDHPDAAGLLATVLAQQGRLDEAVASLHQSLLFRPDAPETYHTLGLTLARQQKLEEAAAAFRQALRHRPDFPEAHNSLGNTLLRQQKQGEACDCYRQAIAARPGFAQAHCNLGIALLQQGRADEALASIEQALRLDPDYVEAEYNLATAYRRVDRLDEAVAAYLRVLEKKPEHAEAHCGLGAARLQLGDPDAALGCFDRALAARPNDADFHTNKGLTLLLMGDYERGWEEYEWRLKQRSVPPRLVPQPMWDGRPLPGGTILLYAEQGMGDTIQAVRYARLVKERVPTVLLECPAPLRGLLASCPGIDGVVDPETAAPAADVQLPLMSLMRVFGTRPGTIPAPVPYVFTDAALREKWRRELAHSPSPGDPEGVGDISRWSNGSSTTGWRTEEASTPKGSQSASLCDPFGVDPNGQRVPVVERALDHRLISATPSGSLHVGIVWQGNPKLPGDMYRSVKLTQFAPLARVLGVRLYSLQKGTGAEQLAALDGRFAVTDLASKIASDFRDTAAVIEQLDLVIAVDTSVAHLAGALGRPVWLLLPYYPDWRWRRQGADSPWYPTARLFRQPRRGDWDGVFAEVAAALARLAEEPSSLQAKPAHAAEERIAAQMDALEAAGQLDGRALELARALVAARRRRMAALVAC